MRRNGVVLATEFAKEDHCLEIDRSQDWGRQGKAFVESSVGFQSRNIPPDALVDGGNGRAIPWNGPLFILCPLMVMDQSTYLPSSTYMFVRSKKCFSIDKRGPLKNQR